VLQLNLLERFNNPNFILNNKWTSFDNYYIDLINDNSVDEILGKFSFIINEFIKNNSQIYEYRFPHYKNIDIRILKNIFPNSFQMFECGDGAIYFIKKIIINDRYCF